MRGAATSTMVMRFFYGNCFEEVSATWGTGGNACSFARRIARVKHVHRNILLHRRQDGRGMQYLGAEISELSRFVKADDFNPACIRAHVRIGGHHTVDVGPYLDLLRT